MSDNIRSIDALRADRQALAHIGGQSAKQAGATVEAFFQANKDRLSAYSDYIRPERLLKIAQNAIRQTPGLQRCTVRSLFGAVVLCAAMGLEPNTHEGHVYLIPRRKSVPVKDDQGNIVKDRNGKWVTDEVWEVQVQIGYKGRIALAYRSPQLKSLTPHMIREKDKFRIVEGSNPRIEHEPYTRGDAGPAIIYYVRAKLESGDVVFKWMNTSDINRIRDQYSDAYRKAVAPGATARDKNTPWITNYDEMALKTVMHQISDWLPSNRQSALAQAIDNREFKGLGQSTGDVLDGDVDAALDDDDGEEPMEPAEQSKLTHEETIPLVINKTTEPVTVDLGSLKESTGLADGKDESPKIPKAQEKTEPVSQKPAAKEGQLSDGVDLTGQPTPWYEHPAAALTGRALTAAKKGAEAGAVTLEQARSQPKEFWSRMGAGEGTYSQLDVALARLARQNAPADDSDGFGEVE